MNNTKVENLVAVALAKARIGERRELIIGKDHIQKGDQFQTFNGTWDYFSEEAFGTVLNVERARGSVRRVKHG